MLSILHKQTAEERMQELRLIIKPFAEVGERHDQTQTVPIENINALRTSGYTALPLERKVGGQHISLSELISLQEAIATADGPTALCIGWHMGTMYQLATEKNWPATTYDRIAKEVVENGVLLNTAATEKSTGSPTRGGVFTTVAKDLGSNWLINGTKTFTTLAEELDYFLLLATIEDSSQTGLFLVPKGTAGVDIEKNWDMMSMSTTGSHDLHLKDVSIPKEGLIRMQSRSGLPTAWLLHIPACYLGIAKSALQEAVQFANSYSPNSITGTISQLPQVKQKLGEAAILYEQARHFLYGVAKDWDEGDIEVKKSLTPQLMMTKYSVANSAIQIVDLSMRVVGAHSLANSSPLSRHYRNVRAGLHNPPMDDKTIEVAADWILQN